MHNLGHSRSNGCFQSGRIHRCMTFTDIHRGSTETNSTDAKDVQQVTQCSGEVHGLSQPRLLQSSSIKFMLAK